jgi:hypothetical protein
MASLARVIPIPKSISLAGKHFNVWPARLIDLARLENAIASMWGDPLRDLLSSGVMDLPDGDRSKSEAIARAKAKASEGPPQWDGGDAGDFLATPEGVVAFVSIALGRGHPDLEVNDIVSLCCDMSPDEFLELRRAFYWVDTLDQVMKIGQREDKKKSIYSSGADWTKIIDKISSDRNWTYEYVYSLTLREIECVLNSGDLSSGSFKMNVPGQKMTQEDYDRMVISMTGRSPSEMWGDKNQEEE